MLTEEYLKDHFITAHFCDNERKNIEILMTSEDRSATIPYYIPFDEKDGEKKWKDICVIESHQDRPTMPCDWLEVDQANNCVFLKRRPKGRIIGREEMKLFYG